MSDTGVMTDQNQEKKSRDINGNPEVVLLSPPYSYPPRPSIALSIFKACLTKAGISSVTLYPMFRMAELMDADLIKELSSIPSRSMFEEYIFSHLTGLKRTDDLDRYIRYACLKKNDTDHQRVKENLLKAMRAAEQITEETARYIVRLSPKVLAVSSVFYQLNGALSIIRRVKQLDPKIITLMGGPNCMGEAGEALLRFYSPVDAVFFGEGDEVFAETIKALEDGTHLPYGCLRREDIEGTEPGKADLPYRLTKDMDSVPIPDYSDFFLFHDRVRSSDVLRFMTESEYYGADGDPLLLIEGSRGCWWGQHRPCSFCSLNGVKNIYRKKSSKQIYEELLLQYQRHGLRYFEFTDNVIPTQFLDELVPLLEQSDIRFDLFAEVKPIFSERQLLRLAGAGFGSVQTGIETLNDHLLKLLNKGGDTATNIRFLRDLRHVGIKTYWNFLYKIPGEEKEDYEEMLSLLPLLYHLSPPTGIASILFEKQGAYVSDPKRFGLKVTPQPIYYFLFGNHKEFIELIAHRYDDTGEESVRMRTEMSRYHLSMADIINDWRHTYAREEGCHLLMEDKKDYLFMTDTRPCAKMTLCFLKEPARTVSLMCYDPKTFESLLTDINETGMEMSKEDLKDCLSFLIDNRYMVHVSGKYLTLAIKKE
ncbi:MAG: RiPP maturation radical SAM C-methyltransferase [Lachnospiraceae bacterium]|nr:RiPP maturation radical SAM C-methyltransferase [Lachnospiraceae bacterium]